MSSLRIVFAGTPEFGLPCLNALIDSSHQLIAVYTQPDRPAGRGRKVQYSAVKNWALAHQYPVYQPAHFKEKETLVELAALRPDILVVIAYGLILPRTVLSLPRLGCINVHASLLPNWRGASPIQQALLHGDTQTGVTIMQMNAGMDTGDQLACVTCPIYAHDTAAHLHDRLAQLAVKPLLTTLTALSEERAVPTPQPNEGVTYAAKIKKEDAAINWQKTARDIDRQIRAFNPWPIAYTQAEEALLRIYRAQVIDYSGLASPGTIISLDKTGMLVATGQQALLVEVIQFPGSKAMTVSDWLNAGRSQLRVGLMLR